MSGPFRKNLDALRLKDRALAARIQAAPGSARVTVIGARTGAPVPALTTGQRRLPLHSTVDPVSEGDRFHAGFAGSGYVAFLGLAGGYHIRGFLRDPAVCAALVVEKDASLIRSLLEAVDVSDILGDSRVRLLVDAGPDEIARAILDSYLPAAMGDFRAASWRSRCDQDSEYFALAAGAAARAADATRADYAAQSRFGRRWLANILLNLPAAENVSFPIPRSACVLVAAAGPSLDSQLPLIRSEAAAGLLVSTDTALPALWASGIRPDLALSIDCQQYGYHHFFPPAGASTPRLLDLVSPPVLARAGGRVGFFAGGHPLCGYLRRRWRRFPALDTSGGNVAHAAVSLASSLGAGRVVLFGLDYSYPDGKPYARGTYLSTYFASRSSALSPVESSFFSLMFRTGDVRRESIDGGYRYTTALMRMYRDSMERLLAASGVKAERAPGRGLPIGSMAAEAQTAGTQPSTVPAPSARASPEAWDYPPPASVGWRELLREYAGRLGALSFLPPPVGISIARLPAEEREVWATILPLVPAVERETGKSADRAFLLETARSLVREKVARALLGPG